MRTSQRMPGLVVVLSSPSGTGKTTICRKLVERHADFRFSISATTRPARGRERNGRDYHFVSETNFNSMIRNGELAEWATVFGHRYGTLISEIDRALSKDQVLLCDIDVQGGMNLKGDFAAAVTIFVIPPSLAELKRRLQGRKTDSSLQRRLRLKTAVQELSFWRNYDYIVLNDNLKDSTDEVDRIIAAERAKTIRRNQRRFWGKSQARLLGLGR